MATPVKDDTQVTDVDGYFGESFEVVEPGEFSLDGLDLGDLNTEEEKKKKEEKK